MVAFPQVYGFRSEPDVVETARGLLDAFNTDDWEGFRAITTTNTGYNEVGTQRIVNGQDDLVDAVPGWKTA